MKKSKKGGLLKGIEEIKLKTHGKWVEQRNLFTGIDEDGKNVPLSKLYGFDNSFSTAFLIREGFLKVNENNYVTWNSGEIVDDAMITLLRKGMNKLKKEKEEKTVKTIKEKIVQNVSSDEISKEEFLRLYHTEPDSDTIPEILKITTLVYEQHHLITIKQSSHKVFRVAIDGGKIIDARDYFKITLPEKKKKRNSQISAATLRKLNILDESNVWIGGYPTEEMAKAINVEARYQVFLSKERVKKMNALLSKPTETSSSELTEDTSSTPKELPGTIEVLVGDNLKSNGLIKPDVISKEEFMKCDIKEMLYLVYEKLYEAETYRLEKEVRDRELEEQRSKNSYDMIQLLSQAFKTSL